MSVLALMHQANVPGEYDDIRATLSSPIAVSCSEGSEPNVSWWRFPGSQRLTAAMYDNSALYHDVIGWNQCKSGSSTVRCLPGSMTLSKETDLADMNVKIGGVSFRPASVGSSSVLRVETTVAACAGLHGTGQ